MAGNRTTRKRKREELFVREVEVTKTDAHITSLVQRVKGGGWEVDVGSWLSLEGRADEPVGDVSDVEISLRAEEKEKTERSSVACVGVVVNVRPRVTAVVGVPQVDFDHAWTLAASGMLRYARLVFTKPRYRTAFVQSFSLSNQPTE